MAKHRCTCDAPRGVDLTLAFFGEGSSDQEQLVRNLEAFGWSPVELKQVNAHTNSCSDLAVRQLLERHRQWKDMQAQLFDDPTIADIKYLTYITSESGSPDNPEPKKSLELKRCRTENCNDDGNAVLWRMRAWTCILHKVAETIQKVLDIPENLLLTKDAGQTLDLLRAFSYDAVPSAVGSSPHTGVYRTR